LDKVESERGSEKTGDADKAPESAGDAEKESIPDEHEEKAQQEFTKPATKVNKNSTVQDEVKSPEIPTPAQKRHPPKVI